MQLFLRRAFSAAIPVSPAALMLAAAPARAQAPVDWEMGLQAAHSPVMRNIHALNNELNIIITLITLFVAALLAVVIYRFRASRNPVPGRASHNTLLEVTWTIAPVLILVLIAIPSFRLIYYEDRAANPDMTLKVTGHQWYWEYTYPDSGNLDFTSYMIPDNQLKAGQKRLLDVDNQVVLPAGKTIRILISSGDVIHSWFVPSVGVQRYAIPGRVDETWVKVDEPGIYYGECNQICGTNHSFMPIAIRAVTPAEFTAWVAEAKTKFASDAPASGLMATSAPLTVAQVLP